MVSIQRHLLNLRAVLQPGETERAWIRAERTATGHVGALMATDRRVLFSGLGFFAPSLDAVPLVALRHPVLVPGDRRDVLGFEVLGEERRYAARPRDAARFRAALDAAMADAGIDPASSDGGGLATELERLAALRSSGVLTEEEFAEAKRVLLARPPA